MTVTPLYDDVWLLIQRVSENIQDMRQPSADTFHLLHD